MSLFDVIKYPLSYPPTEEELTNLPEPMFRLFIELSIEEFNFIPLLGENVYEYWAPQNIVIWMTNHLLTEHELLWRRKKYIQITNEVRKVIAELP